MTGHLEGYKIFYYVVTCGGITAAARELCVSQPAVSQALRQLEERLGAVLVMRSAKGIRLTGEGEALFSYVKEGYETIEQGELILGKMLNMDIGEVTIGASDMTLQFYLLPFLEDFHRKYPAIKVNVTNAPTPETIEHLQNGRIDFGIVTTPVVCPEGVKVTVARDIEDVFVVGKRFWEYKTKLLSYKSLLKLPVICLENNTSTRRYLDEFLKQEGVTLKPEFELATSDMIVQFALRNLGVGCVMSDFAKDYLETGELSELHFDKKIPKRSMCVISRERNPLSTAASTLLKQLRKDKMD